MSGIKNFIFDFGGVLYNINIDNAISNFRDCSSKKALFSNPDHSILIDNSCVDSYERGEITTEQFRNCLRKQFHLDCNDIQFDKAWNSILTGINPIAENIIQQLSKKARLSLLSNTSPLHFEKFEPECRKLFSYFDHIFLTFDIGFRKPEEKAFEHVISQTKYKGEETLFIDDSKKNIEFASKAGLKVFHLEKPELLSDLLHTV